MTGGARISVSPRRPLPGPQADVVALRVIAGLTVAETVAALGKSDRAVSVLAHRGLRDLAERVPSAPGIATTRSPTVACCVTTDFWRPSSVE